MADMTAPAAHVDDLLGRLRLEITTDARATVLQWLSEHGDVSTEEKVAAEQTPVNEPGDTAAEGEATDAATGEAAEGEATDAATGEAAEGEATDAATGEAAADPNAAPPDAAPA